MLLMRPFLLIPFDKAETKLKEIAPDAKWFLTYPDGPKPLLVAAFEKRFKVKEGGILFERHPLIIDGEIVLVGK